jgi:ferredoxin-type protein NapH
LPGIKNSGVFFRSATRRGAVGILAGAYLIGFYILLYWYPEFMVNLLIPMDPVSQLIR